MIIYYISIYYINHLDHENFFETKSQFFLIGSRLYFLWWTLWKYLHAHVRASPGQISPLNLWVLCIWAINMLKSMCFALMKGANLCVHSSALQKLWLSDESSLSMSSAVKYKLFLNKITLPGRVDRCWYFSFQSLTQFYQEIDYFSVIVSLLVRAK